MDSVFDSFTHTEPSYFLSLLLNQSQRAGLVQLTAIVKCGFIGKLRGGLTQADSCALWLQEHRVFEMIFVDAPNDALVPEALVLLQGLLKKGWLRASHLECIWDASVGTHEALSATMHVLIADICMEIPHVLLVEVLQYVARSLVEDGDRDGDRDTGGGGGRGGGEGRVGGSSEEKEGGGNKPRHRATVGLGATRHVPEAVQLSRRLLGQQDGTPEEKAAAAAAREGRTKRMFDENVQTCIAMVEILWSLAMSPVLGESRTRGGGGGHRASSTGGDDPADPMHNDVAFVQLYVSQSNI